MSSRNHFQGKRVAVIGLGPHGEMIADIRYLVKAGALVSVYDLSSELRVHTHLAFLSSIGLAAYLCGSVPAEDLPDMDLIILSREYPRESSFLKLAQEKGVPVEYPETLFFKLAPPVTVVGVLGACGKSTVVSMLAPMLEEACKLYSVQGGQGEQSLYVIDPELEDGVLTHLKKLRSNDMALVRMTAPLMRDLHAMRMSPHVAIFTTIPPAGSYADSPFEILGYQTYNNFIVAPDQVIDATYTYKAQSKAKMMRVKATLIPSDWPLKGRGAHDRDNAALAVEAARIFKVSDDVIRRILGAWKPIKGRLEMVKKVKNAEFYNDSASISPYATMAAVRTLGDEKKNLILIFGGSETAGDYRELYALMPKSVRMIISLPGSGTLRERKALRELEQIETLSAPSIEEAVRLALENSQKGDKVLFSPGFEAGGFDRSRKERGERFVRAVRSL